MPAPRICHIGRAERAGSAWQTLERAKDLGFDTVLTAAGSESAGGYAVLARACESRGLSLFIDLNVQELDLHHPLVEQYPDAFAIRRHGEAGSVVDPRHPSPGQGCALLRETADPAPLVEWWSEQIAEWVRAGARGFRMLRPATTPRRFREALIERALGQGSNRVTFIADTTGEPRDRVARLAGFDYCLSSLPWWDGRSRWLVEEYEALSHVAPLIAQVESPAKLPPASSRQRCGRLAIGLVTGTGLMVPLSYTEPAAEGEDGVDLGAAIRGANEFVATTQWVNGQLKSLTGAGAPITVLLRADGRDARLAKDALVALINPDPTVAAEPTTELLGSLGAFGKLEPAGSFCGDGIKLKPGEARLYRAKRAKPIVISGKAAERDVNTAVESPRVIIANVSPAVDDGAFAVKAIVGQRLSIEADILTDGHPVLAAELQYKAEGERNWQLARMRPLANDRWQAVMPLDRIGRHVFAIEAWIDEYGSFVRDLRRKRDAGLDLSLEIQEGQQLLDEAKQGANGVCAQALGAILRGFEGLSTSDRVALLLAPETVETMHRVDTHRFHARTGSYPIDAERKEAAFSSWYELFPRSETEDAARHGTFRDVIARLPAIRDMGFDVVYFPPIHPVGKTNRKGRNNALRAEPNDVGSVYAIGSTDGGHDAIHPQLGTLDDFRALVASARENGLELALDLAVQASPDHPWLSEHPGWFDWRPDGTIKYAENPPKKYEDIVNVDFYAKDAVPELWTALRDVVLFWIEQDVKIFRVDNPHTKPFPFWQWLIADVRGSHPDVIFLSEAFTRPKVMYHLAKLGFSQSYTYFIWRNTKQELTQYMRELASPPVSDFFRPHFFVNTPDINPHFLQGSGRAGFLIRAALATTLSGLWGMYSGYELCESAALPGREEYLDSEKYEIRPRDWNAPGNIVREITQLNRLRKAEPALQSHLGLTFYNAFNDNILYFGKSAPGHADRILVAISLDPHDAQEADFEIPLWEWGRADHEVLECEDLLNGSAWIWRGKIQHMRLTPETPYAIWRVQPAREV
ncbi:MAG: alpha-1,4-glucan--maltose-1-phosphate maltosyltransferase [Alphaproteobacteria bacterium]|nr:alpha-1,4-glucan--maltose-1-phosphate maltosyltransferase [Alphaproteobacteria bacterium]